MNPTRLLLAGLSCLALISHAEDAVPLQLIGTTQIDRSFTAYLRENGGGQIFTLGEGETANGWRITDTTRDTRNHVVRIHLQRGRTSLWLGIAGASTSHLAPGTAKPNAEPLIDIPVSASGRLHDQMLHRSRIKHKLEVRRALRETSDLDPFPTKGTRSAR